MSCTDVASIGSKVTPTTMSLPFGPRPLISSDIALELGAVARMTCAPPNFCNFLGYVRHFVIDVHARSEFPCERRVFRPAPDSRDSYSGMALVTNFLLE